MTVLRDHYYRLASEQPAERLDAATKLLSELSKVNTTEEWDYALNRLVKGLITTRQSARYGFSMALTEVVRELIYRKDTITIQTFLDLVLETTQVKSSMKGKEERSVLFGRLFGLQILINSQVLFDHTLVSEEVLLQFVTCLIELSNMKSWLRETTIFTLCQFIKLLTSSTCELDSKIVDSVLLQILQITNDEGLNLSTEGIAIYLSIPNSSLAREIQNPKSTWKNFHPLAKGNLQILAKALKDVDVVDVVDAEEKTKNSKQKGSWNPRIPFVWDLIIEAFNNSDESESITEQPISSKKRKSSSASPSKRAKSESNMIHLQEFWKVVVDESLFSEKSSHERKYWGFDIFIKFLTTLSNYELVEYLFTSNLLRCLVNQSSQANRFLNKISIKVLQTLIEASKKNILKGPIIVSKLLDESNGGCWNFDLITKSKTIDHLLTIRSETQQKSKDSSKDSSKELTQAREMETVLLQYKDILINQFKNTLAKEEQKSHDNILKWTLDKLLLLVRNSKNLTIKPKFTEEILKLLIKHGFFSQAKAVSSNIRNVCQERLNSILADIIMTKRGEHSWSLFCVEYIVKLESSSKYENLVELDEEVAGIKLEVVDTLKAIEELYLMGKKDQLYCFELLFSMVLIQLYMGDEEAVLVIGEIKVCYEDTFSGEDSSNATSTVLTEIILSFASRKSSLLKKISSIVWESFLCNKDETGKIRLSEESLQLMYDVLVARENKEGQKQLFEEGGEYEEGEGEEGEVGDEEEESDSESDSSDSEDSKSKDSDSDSESTKVDPASNESPSTDLLSQLDKDTNLKLASALGIPTGSSGEVKFEDLSSSDDSYESDSMDDEQMMAMDTQLSKIFKERQDILSSIPTGNKRKVEVMEAKEHMIFFKGRILDLLDIFNKAQPNSHLNLSAISPLLTLINLTLDKSLGVKAHKLLKTRINKTRIAEDDIKLYFSSEQELSDYKTTLLTLLQTLLTNVSTTKSSNQAHALACNQACIIIGKNLVSLDGKYLEQVIDLYTSVLKDWGTDPKNNIQPSLFFDFINWLNLKRQEV